MTPEVRRQQKPTETPKAGREQLSGILRRVSEWPREVLRPVRKQLPEALKILRRQRPEMSRPVRKQRPEMPRPVRKQQPEMPRTVISGQQAAVTEELQAAAMADPLRHKVPGETEELQAEGQTELRIPVRAVI